MSLVAAVVPTYRPDPDALTQLIACLTATGIPVLVSDDASPSTSDPVLRRLATGGVPVARHTSRAGIARSLNAGLRFAAEQGATWLLTVDQDSTLPPDYLALLVGAATDATTALGRDRVGAVAAGTVGDASGPISYPIDVVEGVATTPEVIQTGTIWSVPALTEIGGFDEDFGIDAVDAAACVRLRASDRVIVVAPDVALAHRLGESQAVTVFGRTVLATGHSPERRASIVRNRLRLAPEEFRQSPAHALRTLRRVAVGSLLAVTVEDQRWAKAKATVRGLFPRSGR